MDKVIRQEDFLNNLFNLLDETFDNTHGIYLDKGTSLFRTLEAVSANEASIPVGGKCASLAAQVAHVIFYLEVLERSLVYNDNTPADWGEVWRTVEKVTAEEWDALKAKLKDTYSRIEKMFRANEVWNDDSIGGSLAIVVHTAYHLGEIRQALCTLK
ncbi:MAG: DinB family protein [Chloroflexi bacterium]|nr:MAG: DinB family protein [Chloroflexota bacterium]